VLSKFSALEGRDPTGTRLCQCPLCFEVFSGERTFVWHRIAGPYPAGSPGERWLTECRDPASKGLVLGANGVWSRPAEMALGPVIAAPRTSVRDASMVSDVPA
jgi:hypothetical protein